MRGWQKADIVLRLAPRIQHQHIPSPVRASASKWSRFKSGKFWRLRFIRELLVAGIAALFGFEDETITFVEVDPFIRGSAVAPCLPDHPFEDIIIGFTDS